MPRQARRKSESGIYLIMLRGINQQQIFEDREDFEKFLQILKDCKAVSEYKLFAYCLMGNHIQGTQRTVPCVLNNSNYWYNNLI